MTPSEDHVAIATAGKIVTDYQITFVSNYQHNWSDFEEILASEVGVAPLKDQVQEVIIRSNICNKFH